MQLLLCAVCHFYGAVTYSLRIYCANDDDVLALCTQTKAVLAQRVLESLGARQPCAAPVAIIAATLDARRAIGTDVAADVAQDGESTDDYDDYDDEDEEEEYGDL
jgi:hypothetical protein